MYDALCSDDRLPKLLEFVAELPRQASNFQKYTLFLINKYFQYEKMMFFPYHTKFYSSIGKGKEDVYRKYVTLSLSHEAIAAYGKNIRHIDIFAPRRLPASLRSQKILFTEDVMTREEYVKTEYYQRMHALNLGRQACILLRVRDEVMASIAIFRSEDEPPFAEQDRILMEFLSDLISNQYALIQAVSDEMVVKNGFEMFFKGAQVGAIVVNHRLTVILANERAHELGKDFLMEFRSKDEYFLRNNQQCNQDFQKLQEMIDWIGLDLIDNLKGKEFSSICKEYTFSCNPFLFIDSSGDVEIYHLVLISYRKKPVNRITEEIIEWLTPREQEMLHLVMDGLDNAQIAKRTHISVYTVRTHISNIYQKFDVRSKSELLLKLKEL